MKLEIITPERHLFDGEADLVQLPGTDGLFEVLNNHAPMIAALGSGNVKIGNNNNFAITKLFLQIIHLNNLFF